MVSERCSGAAQSEITMAKNNRKLDPTWEEEIDAFFSRLEELIFQKMEEDGGDDIDQYSLMFSTARSMLEGEWRHLVGGGYGYGGKDGEFLADKMDCGDGGKDGEFLDPLKASNGVSVESTVNDDADFEASAASVAVSDHRSSAKKEWYFSVVEPGGAINVSDEFNTQVDSDGDLEDVNDEHQVFDKRLSRNRVKKMNKLALEGGVASGFKKPREEEFETRLYICKGKRSVRLKQVPFLRSSLNHDDVFILDTKDKIYQFNGANSDIQERVNALEVIQYLRDKYHEGKCDVAIVDDRKLQDETDSGEFWVLFGGFAPIGKKVATEDDIIPEKTSPQLYSIIDCQVKAVDGELSKSILENNKCYLLDCGADVIVWVGRVTQIVERKSAIQAAEDFVASQSRPKSTHITRLIQGYETHAFKSNFDSWPSESTPSVSEEGRGKVAALLKQQVGVMKGAGKIAPVNEEVPPLLEGGGKIEVWRINGSAKTPVPSEDIGKFYGGDCYIMLYTYHSHERKEDYYLCCWIGKDSIEEDREMAAKLSTTMYNSLKGRPVQGRIFQGTEPPQFVAIFQPIVILKGGLSSGYKNYIADKGLNDATYTADSVALISISGTSLHNNTAVQVEAVGTSLNSNEYFLLQSGSSVFSWHGNQSTYEQQQLAVKVAEFLKPGSTIKHTKEGIESSSFWFAVEVTGGPEIPLSTKIQGSQLDGSNKVGFAVPSENLGKPSNWQDWASLISDNDALTSDWNVVPGDANAADPEPKLLVRMVFDPGGKFTDHRPSIFRVTSLRTSLVYGGGNVMIREEDRNSVRGIETRLCNSNVKTTAFLLKTKGEIWRRKRQRLAE